MQHPKSEEFLVVLAFVPWMIKNSGFVLSVLGYHEIPPIAPIERFYRAIPWESVV
jgi:hypothetical protein